MKIKIFNRLYYTFTLIMSIYGWQPKFFGPWASVSDMAVGEWQYLLDGAANSDLLT